MRSNVSANSVRLVVLICAMMESSSFFAATRSAFWPSRKLCRSSSASYSAMASTLTVPMASSLPRKHADERFYLRPIRRRAGLFDQPLVKVEERVRLGRE